MKRTTDVRLQAGEWLVLLDGARLRVLENIGTHHRPVLAERMAKAMPAAPDRDLGSDRPGRAVPPQGLPHSAVEQRSEHDAAERRFVEAACGELLAAPHGEGDRSFVVVAPPRAIAVFRDVADRQLLSRVRAEVVADLCKEPIEALQVRFTPP